MRIDKLGSKGMSNDKEREIYDEYYLLTKKLDEISWALKGECDDIDCDMYLYRDLLKKRYKPILEHGFSCMKNLKRNKEAVLRLLSQKKFDKYRYEKCNVCKIKLDKLDEKNLIVSFTKPSGGGRGRHLWEGVWVHRRCSKMVKVPEGWKRFC